MLTNYFKIAFRNILRHKAYSFLNISGLAIGMACSILILLWVQNELSYDKSHENAADIYRLTVNVKDFNAAVSPAGMAEGLLKELPEIKATVRLSALTTRLFEAGNRKFEEKRVFYADSNFLQVFSSPLAKGSAKTALMRPDAVLITEAIARKYFGEQDAMGKTIRINNTENLTVTGILADKAPNSHLQFDFLIPMSALLLSNSDLKDRTWKYFNFYTYLQLDKNIRGTSSRLENLSKRIDQVYEAHTDGLKPNFHLQPLTDIHLHSNLQADLSGNGDIKYVNIFFVVAIFILAVACINFMNLTTARSARRAKEVGLRKVVGAKRWQLILQFLGESIVISFISILLAFGLVYLLLPAFNAIAGRELAIHLFDTNLLLSLLGIALLTGLISGSYPALFLSGFKPISILKGKLKTGLGDLIFRNALVVMQFVVSIILLTGTVVVYEQLNFMKDRNLGFEKSNLLYMPINGDMWGKRNALADALKQNQLTENFSFISDLPVNLTTANVDVIWEGKDLNSQPVISYMETDENFIEVFRMKILNGRNYSSEHKGDSLNYIINETAVKLMGMTVSNAVGKSLSWSGIRGTIIGVVNDFNFKPFQNVIEPLVIRKNSWGGIAVIRTGSDNTEATIKALERISSRLNPSYPFVYNFLDKDIENLYKGEQQMGKIFNLFAVLAIFISCLGLYGLSAFMAEQRTREIGVRKVLGASVGSIVYLLSGKFTRLILIATVIAIPISWNVIESWLQGFAYRVEISWVVFLMASMAALFIAWITVSYESVKAGIMNPVKSLRGD